MLLVNDLVDFGLSAKAQLLENRILFEVLVPHHDLIEAEDPLLESVLEKIILLQGQLSKFCSHSLLIHVDVLGRARQMTI
jgi:hypothetical protein